MRGVEKHPELLSKLGKHKHGRSCLNINKLADIDISVLKQLIEADLEAMNEAYGINWYDEPHIVIESLQNNNTLSSVEFWIIICYIQYSNKGNVAKLVRQQSQLIKEYP